MVKGKMKGASGAPTPEAPNNAELSRRRSEVEDSTGRPSAQWRAPPNAQPVHDGRTRIGWIAPVGRDFGAWLLDGTPLGAFVNSSAAMTAIRFPPPALLRREDTSAGQ